MRGHHPRRQSSIPVATSRSVLHSRSRAGRVCVCTFGGFAPPFLPISACSPRSSSGTALTVKVSAFHGHRDHARPTHSRPGSASLGSLRDHGENVAERCRSAGECCARRRGGRSSLGNSPLQSHARLAPSWSRTGFLFAPRPPRRCARLGPLIQFTDIYIYIYIWFFTITDPVLSLSRSLTASQLRGDLLAREG